MMKKIRFYYQKIFDKIEQWSKGHIGGLFIYNLLVISLLLLKSGGYFYPYFLISINVVVFMSLIGLIILLGANYRVLFLISLFFWIFAAGLRIIGIEVWAERVSIYTFQTMILGVVLIFIENFNKRSD